MAESAQSVEDVKRALLRDIDAGKVRHDPWGPSFLRCDDGSVADVDNAVWSLYRAALCELVPGSVDPAERFTWRLTDAGRSYLEAGTE